MSRRNRDGVLLLVVLASMIALTTLMLSNAHTVSVAAAASRRITVSVGPADDPMASALARAMLHLRRGQLAAGRSYAMQVRVPGGAVLFRLDCEVDPPDGLDLAATPATAEDVVGLPVLSEGSP